MASFFHIHSGATWLQQPVSSMRWCEFRYCEFRFWINLAGINPSTRLSRHIQLLSLFRQWNRLPNATMLCFNPGPWWQVVNKDLSRFGIMSIQVDQLGGTVTSYRRLISVLFCQACCLVVPVGSYVRDYNRALSSSLNAHRTRYRWHDTH